MKPADIITKPLNSIEEISRRTEHSKIFYLREEHGKKKYHTSIVQGAVHYKDNYENEDEEWKEIDFSPEDLGSAIVNTSAPYNIEAFKNKIGFVYTSKRGGRVSVELGKLGLLALDKMNVNITPVIRNNQIWYDNVVDGLDIYLELRAERVIMYKVLKHANAPREFEWNFEEDEQHTLKVNSVHEGWDDDKDKVHLKKEVKNEIITEGKKKYTLCESVLEQTIKIKDKKTRIKEYINKIKYPLLIDVPDITENTTATRDDGFEAIASWRTSLNSFSLIGHYYTLTNEIQHGSRFQTISVPQGSTIDLAVLKLTAQSGQGSPNFKVYADDVDNAASWDVAGAIPPRSIIPSNITKTIANVAWTPTTASGVKSITVTDIVQEIVDRGGWSTNNNMRFGIFNNNTAAFTQGLYVYDYKKSQADAPILEIDYTEGAGPAAVTVPRRRHIFHR